MNASPRVLLSAYACGPGVGSEPGIGWDFVLQAARFNDLCVITRANNRNAIEQALHTDSLRNVRWIYYDLPSWSRFWKRGKRGVQLYYYLWQLGIYSLAKQWNRRTPFDLVHHVTFGKYWAPSLLALLNTRFIWGPLGGGESAPPELQGDADIRGNVYEITRNAARSMGEVDPLVRLTARRSDLALATTEQTAARLQRIGCRNVRLYSPIALQREEAASLMKDSGRGRNSSLRIISCGRLLHWKGFDLGLKAYARLGADLPNCNYIIIGEGPERGNLERLAASLGVSSRVSFLGGLPQDEVFEQFKMSDILLHPSLHDSSGWVCIEAMATGCPVVCLDWAGPGVLVGNQTGIKISPGCQEAVVHGLAEALSRLGRDASLRHTMSAAAIQRVESHFLSERKSESLAALYREALEDNPHTVPRMTVEEPF